MKRATGATATLGLHGLLLAVALGALRCTPAAPPPPPPPPPAATPPGHEIEVRLLSGEDAAGKLACAGPGYVGVGILSMFGVVSMVGPGTPAARAGIRAGDLILNEAVLGRDRYPAGTVLELSVRSEGRVRRVRVTTARICDE